MAEWEQQQNSLFLLHGYHKGGRYRIVTFLLMLSIIDILFLIQKELPRRLNILLSQLISQINRILTCFALFYFLNLNAVTRVLRTCFLKKMCWLATFLIPSPSIFNFISGNSSFLKKVEAYFLRTKASSIASFLFFLSMIASCNYLIFCSFYSRLD